MPTPSQRQLHIVKGVVQKAMKLTQSNEPSTESSALQHTSVGNLGFYKVAV